jgi:hypothetical protein
MSAKLHVAKFITDLIYKIPPDIRDMLWPFFKKWEFDPILIKILF